MSKVGFSDMYYKLFFFFFKVWGVYVLGVYVLGVYVQGVSVQGVSDSGYVS